jgi:hypothetical protein
MRKTLSLSPRCGRVRKGRLLREDSSATSNGREERDVRPNFHTRKENKTVIQRVTSPSAF